MKWQRLRATSINVKEQILVSYARSLIIYFGVPLVVTGIWKDTELDKIEIQYFREILMLPRDIKGAFILNVAQSQRPVSVVVKILAERTKIANKRQTNLDCMRTGPQEPIESEWRRNPRLYIPKILTDCIFAAEQGGSSVHFGEEHLRIPHNTPMSIEHMKECSLLDGRGNIEQHLALIRERNIRDWQPSQQLGAYLAFQSLKIKLNLL